MVAGEEGAWSKKQTHFGERWPRLGCFTKRTQFPLAAFRTADELTNNGSNKRIQFDRTADFAAAGM